MESLFNPALILFLLGIAVGLVFKVMFPDLLSKFLGYYLLFALGLKGGQSLQNNGFTDEVISVLSLGTFFAILIPLISYLYLKNILNTDDAAALSGTYGSVSAVTYVTALTYLSTSNQNFDDFMSAVLVVMEFPAIFMALYFVTSKSSINKNNIETIKTAFMEIPNIVLVSSLFIGYFLNLNSGLQTELLTKTIFEYVLFVFLFVMGTRVARRIGELTGKSKNLIIFALVTPIVGSILALFAAINFNLSVGNSTLLMVLTASASYIAVPAVVKDAIPNANPAIYLGLSLGVTFPFNIIFGIPLYNELAKFFIS
jgi:hypothetical protein|tara:strand:+ start:3263 stop:4201 length:939 start_codon:yes stop_codon:yes gene_type:complete